MHHEPPCDRRSHHCNIRYGYRCHSHPPTDNAMSLCPPAGRGLISTLKAITLAISTNALTMTMTSSTATAAVLLPSPVLRVRRPVPLPRRLPLQIPLPRAPPQSLANGCLYFYHAAATITFIINAPATDTAAVTIATSTAYAPTV